MAKYEKHFRGDFTQVLSQIDRAVMEGSSSASLEDSSDMYCGDARCAVRVYERYSWFGGNRVSMALVVAGVLALVARRPEALRLFAPPAGGRETPVLLSAPVPPPPLRDESPRRGKNAHSDRQRRVQRRDVRLFGINRTFAAQKKRPKCT